ncbi:MAG: extracellular solute-binding protein [Chloroflexi bacterium]|nr:extracellular solute-binding protein [Chloroflexota bacterium]
MIIALTMLAGLVLAACGPAPTPTPVPLPTKAPTVAPTVPPTKAPEPTKPPEPTKTPAPPVELRMMWYNDGNEGEVMRSLLDKFEAANPGIKIKMDTVAYADLNKVLQPQVESGTPPDLARITDLARFQGYFLDLRPNLSNAAAWEANWSPAFLGALRKGDDKTGLYGFPTQFTVSGPFINRTLFAQAGVPVPSDTKEKVTWQEWVDAAKKVAAATKTPYAVAIDRSGHRLWGPSLSMCAHYVDGLTETKFTIDSPGFRNAANMLIGWHKDKITPLDIWAGGGGGYAAGNTFFVNGQLVFYFSGNWQVGQFDKLIGNKFEWDVVPNPYGDCGSTGMPGGAALVTFKATKYPKEVAKLVDYLTQDDVLAEFSAKSLFLPGALSLSKKGIQYPSSNKQMNTFLKEVGKLAPEAYYLQFNALGQTLNPEMRDRLSQVITGELTLDEAIKRIQQKMDDAAAALKK